MSCHVPFCYSHKCGKTIVVSYTELVLARVFKTSRLGVTSEFAWQLEPARSRLINRTASGDQIRADDSPGEINRGADLILHDADKPSIDPMRGRVPTIRGIPFTYARFILLCLARRERGREQRG